MSAPLFKKRAGKNLKKRASPSDSDYSEDETGAKVKRRKFGGIDAASSTTAKPSDFESLQATKYEGDRSKDIQDTNNAAIDVSAKELLGTTRTQEDTEAANGVYKGKAGYSTFIQKKPDAPKKAVGPSKADLTFRKTLMVDDAKLYCKDYQKTGFCGFGDGCIYMHDRGAIKQGWAIDREWEEQNKGKKLKGTIVASIKRDSKDEEDPNEAALLEKIPFACIICESEYKHPVITLCGHYFCENCALKKFKTTPNCAACGTGTKGVFNAAKGLQKLLDRKKKREERLAEKAKREEEEDEE
jgi:RING finger protein 113A